MTKKRDLKKLIRERCKKTGESYATARKHLLAAAHKLCPACKGALSWRTVREMADLDDDATEGQIADHIAAEESGDWGEWAVEVEESFCPRCEPSPPGDLPPALRPFFARLASRKR